MQGKGPIFNRQAAREVKTITDGANEIKALRRLVPNRTEPPWLFIGSCRLTNAEGRLARFEFAMEANTLEEAMATFGQQAAAAFEREAQKQEQRAIRKRIMQPGPVPVE